MVEVAPDRITLHLARQKNRLQGSVLTRQCWCESCERTCPIHVLADFFAKFESGAEPFAGITSHSALSGLKAMLSALRVAESGSYRTQDLRRGHARDLQDSGSNLLEILQAGEWSSPAFFQKSVS